MWEPGENASKHLANSSTSKRKPRVGVNGSLRRSANGAHHNSGSAPAARASASLPTFAFVALAAVLADAVGARYDSAGDDSLHGAPGFRATLGLHRNFPPATTQRIGDAVGIGEGHAGQGQEQGGGKSQFFHSS